MWNVASCRTESETCRYGRTQSGLGMVEPEAHRPRRPRRTALRRTVAKRLAVDPLRQRSGVGGRTQGVAAECDARNSVWRCRLAAVDSRSARSGIFPASPRPAQRAKKVECPLFRGSQGPAGSAGAVSARTKVRGRASASSRPAVPVWEPVRVCGVRRGGIPGP